MPICCTYFQLNTTMSQVVTVRQSNSKYNKVCINTTYNQLICIIVAYSHPKALPINGKHSMFCTMIKVPKHSQQTKKDQAKETPFVLLNANTKILDVEWSQQNIFYCYQHHDFQIIKSHYRGMSG